jgi:hypothetical protein
LTSIDDVVIPINCFEIEYRLFYDHHKFAIEEYMPIENKWVNAKTDPDRLFTNLDFNPEYISKFARIINTINPKFHSVTHLYPDRKISILSLLHANDNYIELCNTNPALAAMLCSHFGKAKISLSDAGKLISMPRKNILKEIVGIGTNSHVRILQQCKEEKYSDQKVRWLNSFIVNYGEIDCYRKLQKPEYDISLVLVLLDNSMLLPYPFYRKFLKETYFVNMNRETQTSMLSSIRDMNRTLQNLAYLSGQLNINNFDTCLYSCKTPIELFKLHSKWSNKNENNLIQKLSINGGNLPCPPIQGNKNIIPIQTVKELYNEATIMQHCISTYYESIQNRKYYAYKVLSPERATLGIKIGNHIENQECKTYYIIDELRVKGNKNASAETWHIVKEWFDKYSGQKTNSIDPF